VKTIPRALIGSFSYLAVCMVLLSIFNVLVMPGAQAQGGADYPCVAMITALYGAKAGQVSYLLILPSTFANLLGMLWCSSRQTWALSRAGYLPQMLSITDNKERTPWRAAIFVAVYAYAMAVFVLYAPNFEGGSGTATDILLNLTIISGVITYIGVGIVYIAFRMKYPAAKRGYRSPIGTWGERPLDFAAYCVHATSKTKTKKNAGGVIVTLISLFIFVGELGINNIFRITFIAFAIKMGISGAYFIFYGRMHLLPTEDGNCYSAFALIWIIHN
jgi:amino acid transporter